MAVPVATHAVELLADPVRGQVDRIASVVDVREHQWRRFGRLRMPAEQSAEHNNRDRNFSQHRHLPMSAAEPKPFTRYRLRPGASFSGSRSEEHTSELQSLMRISYAVFCLKKKNEQKQTHKKYIQ